MAKKKTQSSKTPKKTPKEQPQSRSRLGVAISTLAVVVLVIPLAIFWEDITAWIGNTVNSIWDTLGWGIIFIALVVLILGVLLKQRQLSLLWHSWNLWLGIVFIIMAMWGILALFDLGGSFGAVIIRQPGLGSYLRIAALFIVGIVLAFPEVIYYAFIKPVRWWRNRPKRPVVARTLPPPQKQAPPIVTPSPKPTAARLTTPVTSQPRPQPEIRQVAQDVWKKYGEPAAITIDGWRLPPIDILDKGGDMAFSDADNMQRARLIEEALGSYGVDAKVVQINAGPTVTQFGVEPGWDRRTKEIRQKDKDGNVHVTTKEVSRTRVKVERITSLSNDLALALAAPSIRIEAPVPGKSVVGIEVPNIVSSAVNLRSVLETNSFQKIFGRSKLALALGKGAGGEAEAADLGRMPHLLIAGATGSGKTVCLNSIICCLLLHNTPNDLRLIMIDPKRVELTPFNSIPHLAVPVIIKTDKALDSLRWLNYEMDKRYQQLARSGARNIEGYNKNKQGAEKIPYIILVIDELADLMMAGFDEVEHILCRLAQLSRAVGIHLIVATQRPSVDVVTGLIKANFPTRISFAVTSQVDSRTILDGAGAEKLLGRGDMLFMPTEAAKPKRLQGCFVSDTETERLVYFWGSQKIGDMAPLQIEDDLRSPSARKIREAPKDSLLEAAKQLAKEHENISTSFLQRRLQIGYPRAARLKEQLDEELALEEEEGDEAIDKLDD
ncbi:MAG: DNA translocase FtsK [Dehalococcoidales bacterium]|nr:MAG: DNA translocase FtsK [Dehalococcoidales bacterium]